MSHQGREAAAALPSKGESQEMRKAKLLGRSITTPLNLHGAGEHRLPFSSPPRPPKASNSFALLFLVFISISTFCSLPPSPMGKGVHPTDGWMGESRMRASGWPGEVAV